MKNLAIALFLITNAISLVAQNSSGIKIYQNTDIYKLSYSSTAISAITEVRKLKFSRITLAFRVERKTGYAHEVELFIPEISRSPGKVQFPLNYEFRKDDNTFDSKITSFAIQYEISKRLTGKIKPFAFLLGAGVNPYYVHIESIPKVETAYYSSSKLFGFVINMIPRVKYKVNSRLSLDFNMPLKVYDLRNERYWVKNPNIPIRQQKFYSTSNVFFESAYTMRLGLMYALRK